MKVALLFLCESTVLTSSWLVSVRAVDISDSTLVTCSPLSCYVMVRLTAGLLSRSVLEEDTDRKLKWADLSAPPEERVDKKKNAAESYMTCRHPASLPHAQSWRSCSDSLSVGRLRGFKLSHLSGWTAANISSPWPPESHSIPPVRRDYRAVRAGETDVFMHVQKIQLAFVPWARHRCQYEYRAELQSVVSIFVQTEPRNRFG